MLPAPIDSTCGAARRASRAEQAAGRNEGAPRDRALAFLRTSPRRLIRTPVDETSTSHAKQSIFLQQTSALDLLDASPERVYPPRRGN